jgi:hypothetical protein
VAVAVRTTPAPLEGLLQETGRREQVRHPDYLVEELGGARHASHLGRRAEPGEHEDHIRVADEHLMVLYFSGGYALHEYPDVPAYPASHGCVRVPAGDSLVVWEFATLGTPITIG